MTNRSVMKKKETSHRESKREREILEAARVLFSKKGYSDTTLQEIAERVGITKGTIYLYFQNKEDLIASVIEEEVQKLLDDLTKIKNADMPVDRMLTEMILKILERLGRKREIYRLLNPDVVRMTPSLRKVFKKRLRPFFERGIEVIQETLDEGIEEKVFKPMDSFKVANILQAMVIGLLRSWALGARVKEEDRELLKNLILTGIMKAHGGSR